MDGEPDPTLSGPGPGGETPDDSNAAWRRPGAADVSPPPPAISVAVTDPPVAKKGLVGRVTAAVRSWWNGLEILQMWHVVAIATIVATAGFGGLDTVDKVPKTFEPGKPFDNNQLTINIARASLVNEIRVGRTLIAPAQAGRSYLGVIATVTNDGTLPANVADQFTLNGVRGAKPIGGYRIDDGTMLIRLQPGLTEKLAVVWNIPADAVHPGDAVQVRIPYRALKSGFIIYGMGWTDTLESAVATVPVGVPQ
ncbi:hypothetical protein [Mycobacteroides salmoniphilum]|uniref:hypothetical protein n=1 Tax=Mycobacteroides salmoniphilum TaxID=404941 RepID=UPI001065245C|nr:hypothetical protein [Mycobacteroides salmoniphilum]TDZ78904.1 hypothetical protein DE4586_02067 [Mycobacteroides salmoniphilum]TDZ86481.1 hypothetical protein DE4587_02447 [Mycobacteroides salmoniphilum]